MSAEASPSFQVPNLERGLQILEYMTGEDEEVTITTLSQELGFPLNSVMRIMNALDHHQYVTRNPETKGYVLTNKMLKMSARRAGQKTLLEQSADIMRELRDETGETVVISVLDQGEGLILEQVQGLHPFRFVCDPGTRQAIHASASTKAIMAFLIEAEQNQLIRDIAFDKKTDATITTAAAFRRELGEAKANGYALDRAEALQGVHCIAAPILNGDGTPIAAITITGPADRLKAEEFESIGNLVRDKVAEISRRLGFGL